MPFYSRVASLVRNLLRRERAEQDLDDELRAFVEMAADEARDAGLNEPAARRAALIALGGVEQVKEQVRDARAGAWLAQLRQDVLYASRMLRKNVAFTAVALATLALGIGANTAIFTVVNAVLLRPLPYPEPDRLVSIAQLHASGTPEFATLPDYQDWRDGASTLASIGGAWVRVHNLTGVDEPERLSGAAVTSTVFTTFGVRPILGDLFTDNPSDDRRVVLLGHALWMRRFGGDRNVVGQRVELNGQRFTIAGVMPEGFAWPSWPARSELWVPLVAEPGMTRGYHLLQVVGRLKEDASIESARAQIVAIAANASRLHAATNKEWSAQVTSLLDSTVGSTKRSLWTLMGAVACVLLIACVNVAGLLTARAVSRREEMAVRSAIGASRARLARQLLTESVLLSLAGGAVGLVLATWAIEPLLALTALPRANEVSIDGHIFGVTLGASVLTGFGVGIASAISGSRANLRDALTLRGGGSSGWLRPALLVVEVAAAVVLLTGAGLLLRSFHRLHQVDVGFNPERLLTSRFFLPRASYPAERCVQLYREMIERMHRLQPVEAAAAISAFPFGGASANVVFGIEGRPPAAPGDVMTANFASVTPEYFRTVGIPLLAGRGFEHGDHANAPFVALVSRAMAERFFPDQNAIGQSIRVLGPKPRTIVGIVGDIRQWKVDGAPQPDIYVPHPQFPSGGMFLVVKARSGDPAALIGAVRAEIRALDRNLPIAVMRTADQLLGDTLAQRSFSLVLLSVFGGAALALALVGVYGVLSYAVSQRTRELGIRMALGAARTDVLRLMLWQGLWPVAMGLVTGLATSLLASSLLEPTLFEVRPSDPLTLIAVALLLMVAAFGAVFIPSRRASRIDPLIALQ